MVDPAVTGAGAATPGEKKRSPRKKFQIPDGWIACGFTFEVSWPTDPVARTGVRSHFGARRFADNWAPAQVKADSKPSLKERSLSASAGVSPRLGQAADLAVALKRLVRTGKARILSATLSERWGRLFVSFSCLLSQPSAATEGAVTA